MTFRLRVLTAELFDRMPSILVCLMFLNNETEVLHFGQEYHRSDRVPRLVPRTRAQDAAVSRCGGADLDESRVSARFLCCKVGIFPFVINKYLGWGAVSGDCVLHDPPASAPSCSIRELILFAPVFTVALC